MSKRDEYVRALQEKLEEWNAEIDKLTAKATELTADFQNEHKVQIDLLKAKSESARHKIEEIQKAGDIAWEDMKSGAELAWSAMSEAIQSAKSRFK